MSAEDVLKVDDALVARVARATVERYGYTADAVVARLGDGVAVRARAGLLAFRERRGPDRVEPHRRGVDGRVGRKRGGSGNEAAEVRLLAQRGVEGGERADVDALLEPATLSRARLGKRAGTVGPTSSVHSLSVLAPATGSTPRCRASFHSKMTRASWPRDDGAKMTTRSGGQRLRLHLRVVVSGSHPR